MRSVSSSARSKRIGGGERTLEALEAEGRALRAHHWALQAEAGLAYVPVGDFAWYDHILEWTTLLGAVPARFGQPDGESVGLDTLFSHGAGQGAHRQAGARLRNDQIGSTLTTTTSSPNSRQASPTASHAAICSTMCVRRRQLATAPSR